MFQLWKNGVKITSKNSKDEFGRKMDPRVCVICIYGSPAAATSQSGLDALGDLKHLDPVLRSVILLEIGHLGSYGSAVLPFSGSRHLLTTTSFSKQCMQSHVDSSSLDPQRIEDSLFSRAQVGFPPCSLCDGWFALLSRPLPLFFPPTFSFMEVSQRLPPFTCLKTPL